MTRKKARQVLVAHRRLRAGMRGWNGGVESHGALIRAAEAALDLEVREFIRSYLLWRTVYALKGIGAAVDSKRNLREDLCLGLANQGHAKASSWITTIREARDMAGEVERTADNPGRFRRGSTVWRAVAAARRGGKPPPSERLYPLRFELYETWALEGRRCGHR